MFIPSLYVIKQNVHHLCHFLVIKHPLTTASSRRSRGLQLTLQVYGLSCWAVGVKVAGAGSSWPSVLCQEAELSSMCFAPLLHAQSWVPTRERQRHHGSTCEDIPQGCPDLFPGVCSQQIPLPPRCVTTVCLLRALSLSPRKHFVHLNHSKYSSI